MSLVSGFDASQVEPSKPFEPLPNGDYVCVISASEEKSTASGNGHYLELNVEVIDGECKGRRVFERLNLDNPNATAVEIAKRTLSAICHAVGVIQPRDAMELHGKPFVASIKVEARNDKPGEFTNRIAGDAAASGASAKPATAGVPWAK